MNIKLKYSQRRNFFPQARPWSLEIYVIFLGLVIFIAICIANRRDIILYVFFFYIFFGLLTQMTYHLQKDVYEVGTWMR